MVSFSTIVRTVVFLYGLALFGCASQLERAVSAGDVEAVQHQLKDGAKANGSYWTSMKYPAARAIENNDLAMLKLLRAHGATLLPGYLLVAAEHGSVSVYDYLVRHGDSPNRCGTATTLQTWTEADQSLYIVPPIGAAIARRDLNSVVELVKLGSQINIRCEVSLARDWTYSSILAAALVGDPTIIEYLLEIGAEPNTLSGDAGKTPLAIAAERGYHEVARILLAAGAFHTYDEAVKQPIEYALSHEHQDIVKLLQYAGATVPVRTEPIDMLEKVAVAAIAGAVVVGAVWLLTEGAKYSAYSDYADPVSLSWPKSEVVRSARTESSEAVCRNDYDCTGFYNVCLKRPGRGDGICVKDGSRQGDSSDSVGVRTVPLGVPQITTCPMGFRYDVIYRACVR